MQRTTQGDQGWKSLHSADINQSLVHFLNLKLILITIGLIIIGGFDCHLCVYF